MIQLVEKFLEEHRLKSADYTLLVGFSGGYDSICLLNILSKLCKNYGIRLVALHLNHNWRGQESLQDELNCRKFCESLGIEFFSETLKEPAKKDENSAREARYDFFSRCAEKYANSVVFTAHTQSDNAETLVYRIAKGTGVNGLQGILPVRDLSGCKVYRPLLTVSRGEIEDYCNTNGLSPNVDSSNTELKYKRNFIRHKILPELKEINPNAEKAIATLSKIAVSHLKIVDEYMALIKNDLFLEEKIVTDKFRVLSKSVRQHLVHELLQEHNLDFDSKKIREILEFTEENFDSKSGSTHSITNNLWLFASSKYIYFICKTAAEINKNVVKITSEGKYSVPQTNCTLSLDKFSGNIDKFPPDNSNTACVCLDSVDFELRTRRDGDFITPFGMAGSMKLKKYLNSKGVFQHEKDALLLMTKGSEVFWVIGVGLSDKLRVKNAPTHVLTLLEKCD